MQALPRETSWDVAAIDISHMSWTVNISGCAADSVHRNATANSVNVDFGLAVLPVQELKILRHDQTSDWHE